MNGWYLVIADSLGMGLAEKSLRALGCQVYYPREKIMAMRLGKRIKVERSLLYRYMFVGVVPGISYYDLSMAKGVARVLEDMNERPAEIPDEVVERFQFNERCGQYDHTSRKRRLGLSGAGLKEGSKVRVLDGQFEGYTGIVRRSSSLDRVRVFLAEKFIVQVPLDNLICV